jgi:hypothetical protein
MQERTSYLASLALAMRLRHADRNRLRLVFPPLPGFFFRFVYINIIALGHLSERPFTTIACFHSRTPSIQTPNIIATFLWQQTSAARNSFATLTSRRKG